MTPEEKALLLSIGSARIDEALLSGTYKTTATAGPGAGGSSFFIRSGNRRVRLSINPASPLSVVTEGDHVAVCKGETIITRGVLESPLFHCPEQAYITRSERCIFDCRFCPVPKLQGEVKDTATIVTMVEEGYARELLNAISLTSGVADTPDEEVVKMAEVVSALRERFDLPIGVSVYPTASSSEILAAAGADEIKYNVETMDPDIFTQVCPGLSLEFILDALEHAVEIFGKNAVFSNIILGLGEDDYCIRRSVTHLAERGVIPILRPIAATPLRAGEIIVNRPSPERLLRLARMEKDILTRLGLDPRNAKTMCLPCTGCDLTPFRDI
ncbi:MAG: biotin synthase [Methanoregulaceae archaeon PtaB.Bin108]|nr:MAG: biotin synthase [Methanoregulaceae archaeon PtaB.Bin108]